MIKVLHLSGSDINGGAARAAYRIHRSFLQIDEVDSRMLVMGKASGDWRVSQVGGPKGLIKKLLWGKLHSVISRFWMRGRMPEDGIFSCQLLSYPGLLDQINQSDADLVHLHLIAAGMLKVEAIAKIKKPIVWTFHDMSAMTGGWHYQGDPNLREQEQAFDKQNRKGIERRLKAWKDLNLHLVCPSQWLAQETRESAVFEGKQVELIPYAINEKSFQPHDRAIARGMMGLPEEGRYLCYTAMSATSDKRKGYAHLKEVLGLIREMPAGEREGWRLLIVGADEPETPEDLGLPIHYLGTLRDDVSLSLVYSAADVFLAPSRQDNLPNTVIESLSCGTPVVAFDIGGMPDMITHQKTGFLAEAYDAGQLLEGIRWVLSEKDQAGLRTKCRQAAREKFDETEVASEYGLLYKKILSPR